MYIRGYVRYTRIQDLFSCLFVCRSLCGWFLAGEEAYLRTKRLLDEAASVSNMLFVDEQDMSQRYQKAYEREDALDSAAAAAEANNAASASFGGSSLFFPAGGVGGDGEATGGGILAAAAARSLPFGAVDRRPEEKLFCDAFLDLQSLRVRPFFCFRHDTASADVTISVPTTVFVSCLISFFNVGENTLFCFFLWATAGRWLCPSFRAFLPGRRGAHAGSLLEEGRLLLPKQRAQTSTS